jgi:uncharacterized protein with PQ loop repeat
MYSIFGWLSSIAFGISAIPQAYKSYKDGHSNGISNGLLILWIFGELTGFIYSIGLMAPPLMINYIANTVFISIIIWFKLKPRK